MAVTTKKITTVDTATTFDDVFVNTNGTLRQVTKENFQQASGITALNNKWKRIASIESVDSLVQKLVPAGTPSNMLAGFVWLQDTDKIILPTLGWFKGYYTFQNAYGSPYDAGGYIYLTDGNGKPYGEIYITGTQSAGLTAVLNNKPITRAEVDANTAAITALNSRLLKNIGDSTDADLDALTTPGIYYTWIKFSSTAPGKDQWSFLIVASPSKGYCSQVLITAQTSLKIASRYMNNNVWSNWFVLS